MDTAHRKFDTIYTGDFSCYDGDDDTVTLKVELIPESSTSPIVRSICMNENKITVNNKIVEAGSLCFVFRNVLNEYVDAEINDKGELIIHGNNADRYSIVDGELIYTEHTL